MGYNQFLEKLHRIRNKYGCPAQSAPVPSLSIAHREKQSKNVRATISKVSQQKSRSPLSQMNQNQYSQLRQLYRPFEERKTIRKFAKSIEKLPCSCTETKPNSFNPKGNVQRKSLPPKRQIYHQTIDTDHANRDKYQCLSLNKTSHLLMNRKQNEDLLNISCAETNITRPKAQISNRCDDKKMNHSYSYQRNSPELWNVDNLNRVQDKIQAYLRK